MPMRRMSCLAPAIALNRPGLPERFTIIAERWLSFRDLLERAAHEAGARPPLWHVPTGVMDESIRVIETFARLLRVETCATMASLDCSRRMNRRGRVTRECSVWRATST
jgi:hypothetical protein